MKDFPPRPDIYAQFEDINSLPPLTEEDKARLAQQYWMRANQPYGLLARQAGYDDIDSPIAQFLYGDLVPTPMPRPRPNKSGKKDSK